MIVVHIYECTYIWNLMQKFVKYHFIVTFCTFLPLPFAEKRRTLSPRGTLHPKSPAGAADLREGRPAPPGTAAGMRTTCS